MHPPSAYSALGRLAVRSLSFLPVQDSREPEIWQSADRQSHGQRLAQAETRTKPAKAMHWSCKPHDSAQLPPAEGPVPPTSLQGACPRSDWSLASGAGPTFWLILLPSPNVDAGRQGQSSEFLASRASHAPATNSGTVRQIFRRCHRADGCPSPGFVLATLRPDKLSQTHRPAPSNTSEVSS